jgi:cystathionine beta-synthase
MRDKGFDQLPVSSANQPTRLVGLVTLGNLLSYISSGRSDPEDPVKNVMFNFTHLNEVVTDPTATNLIRPKGQQLSESQKRPSRKGFVEITKDTELSALSRFFEWNSAAVVTEKQDDGALKPVGVVTKVDLLTWMVKAKKNQSNGFHA